MWTTTCQPPVDPRDDRHALRRSAMHVLIAFVFSLLVLLLTRGCAGHPGLRTGGAATLRTHRISMLFLSSGNSRFLQIYGSTP